MRKMILLIIGIAASISQGETKNVKPPITICPRVRFSGDHTAQIATAIFAETLQDIRNKIENGDNEMFPAGFFHTSTEPEGVPEYYNDMWSRDCGRGVIELARLGFSEETKSISRYFLSHITFKDHWGRELHKTSPIQMSKELDGNALILSSICWTWRINGRGKELGTEFCNGIKPVVQWIHAQMKASPYHGLLPSISELSGNPSTDYPVYSIFGNYGIYTCLTEIEEMATACGQTEMAKIAQTLHSQMEKALLNLVSDGQKSYAPEGCWFNGIDGRNGRAYDMSEWDGTAWPVWHWTRQLPYILDYDNKRNKITGPFRDIHISSYELLRKWMVRSEYFRKYGFVSNTGWSGMGGRHDETMCGYGQGFFTQAALLADDINVYSKCLEGIARLGYDGNVVDHMSHEKNPFVMHECFNFGNYEKALDHTFGVHKEGRKEIMENPGDEGNLVQESEIIKAFSIVVGVSHENNKLTFMPRLPWLWDYMECKDWPVADNKGQIHRLNISIQHERWLRRCTVTIEGAEKIDSIDIRFGPFPRLIKNPKGYEVENNKDGCWIWKRNVKTNKIIIDL